MKKRILLILFLIALVLVPATSASLRTSSAAHSKFALGLNLGTNTGLGFQYRASRDFDLIGNLGLNNFGSSHLSFDIAANYKIGEFRIERAVFDVTMGGGAFVGIPLNKDAGVKLFALVPFGVVYHFSEVPIDTYIRIAPGLQIIDNSKVDLDFGFSGYIGALWRFN